MRLALYTLACLSFPPTAAHVRLTFPPARYPDLDFLDNARTPGPCGVPRSPDGLVTPLLAGSRFYVTWVMAYRHEGGFSLELLDASERVVAALGSGSSAATHAAVRLPPRLECRGCTLRLLRQAQEWTTGGSPYLFWSCADVDITTDPPSESRCGGHGRWNARQGRCYCDRLYQGSQCQYKDECWPRDDSCPVGKCTLLDSKSYPRPWLCLCDRDSYGEGCSKNSDASRRIDESLYQRVELGQDGDNVLWRMIPESNEMEMVGRFKTASWVGIGWKPRGATCSMPSEPPIRQRRQAPEPEPQPENSQAEPYPNSEPQSDSEPHSESEPHSDSEPHAEPEHGPSSEPEPESASSSNQRQNSAPEPQSAAAEPSPGAGSSDSSQFGAHPMDCADMVIGFALDGRHQVGDFYTVSRATPRRDDFYGGAQSDGLGLAWEEDGRTTLLFRRRLDEGTGAGDQPMSPDNLFIWAKGQARGYDADILGYHGGGRGVFTL